MSISLQNISCFYVEENFNLIFANSKVFLLLSHQLFSTETRWHPGNQFFMQSFSIIIFYKCKIEILIFQEKKNYIDGRLSNCYINFPSVVKGCWVCSFGYWQKMCSCVILLNCQQQCCLKGQLQRKCQKTQFQ